MMTKTCHIILAASIASAAWAAPTPPGPAAATQEAFLSRGAEMMTTGNFRGTIDQLSHIATENIPLSPTDTQEFLFLLGSAYFNTSDPRCLQLLEEFIRDNPASIHAREARIYIADFYFFAHDWQNAADAYRNIDIEALDADSRHQCAYRLALSLLKCGEYAMARPLIKSIANVKEFRIPAAYYDAYIDYAQGRDDQAMAKFERLCGQIDNDAKLRRELPDGIYPEYYMAQLYFRRGEWQRCAALAENLLRGNEAPELRVATQRILGISFYESGYYDQARTVLTEYVESTGDDATPDALYALGACEYRDGDLASAAARFSRAADEDSALGQGAALYLGQIEAAIGSPSGAAMNFEKAYRMNYDRKVSETALYNYVAARSKGGNIPFDSSVELLEQFIRTYPQSEFAPAIERNLASLYYSQGDFDKAIEAMDRIARPSEADLLLQQKILYTAGSSALSAGDAGKAAPLLRRASGIGSHDHELTCQSQIWLGDALYALSDYAAAEKAYAAAINSGRAGSNAALLDYDMGYALLMQDKFAQARRYFAKAAAASGLSVDLRGDAAMRLADCKYYTGDYEGALADFARMRAGANPDYALYRHAQMLGLRGDINGKIRELESFERDYADSRWLPNALGELADTYAAQGDNTKAAAAYGRMLDRYPVAPGASKAALGRANALMAAGNTEEAVEAYRQLLMTRPASDEARAADRELRRHYAATHQVGAYAEFIQDVPGYSVDAADLDDLAYESAEAEYLDNSDNVSAISGYIRQFPDGRHIAEAYSIYAAALADSGDRAGALKAYRELERRGGAAYAAEAWTGIMRNADNADTQLMYARRLRSAGGADADALEEADFYEATALIDSDSARDMREGERILTRLAENPYSLFGARSAVTLAGRTLDAGDAARARDLMEDFTSSGSEQQYWVARGFIVLADAYSALGKDYLAQEYLRSLQQNYPGKEEDIKRMISSRLK